jgi:hypothetical protein
MNRIRFLGWLALIVAGAALALLVIWLTKVVSVPLTALLAGLAAVVGLCWLVALVTVPWNLYFAARRALATMTVSRERGIAVRAADDAEAERIGRRMLGFALGAHAGTALASALVGYLSGSVTGYYVAGLFLLSTSFRPAAAYFWHVRERIRALTRESTFPRDDVATLTGKVEEVTEAVDGLRAGLDLAQHDLLRTEAALTDGIAHARQLLTTDLARLQDAQAADRAAARSGHDDLSRRIDQMTRRIEATLDGLSDQEELLTGLRALVRMVRSDPA